MFFWVVEKTEYKLHATGPPILQLIPNATQTKTLYLYNLHIYIYILTGAPRVPTIPDGPGGPDSP